MEVAGLGIIIVVVLIVAVGVLLIFAPLMLYGIFSRQGETNDLLRYLAERSSQPQAPPSRRPESAGLTFHTLG